MAGRFGSFLRGAGAVAGGLLAVAGAVGFGFNAVDIYQRGGSLADIRAAMVRVARMIAAIMEFAENNPASATDCAGMRADLEQLRRAIQQAELDWNLINEDGRYAQSSFLFDPLYRAYDNAVLTLANTCGAAERDARSAAGRNFCTAQGIAAMIAAQNGITADIGSITELGLNRGDSVAVDILGSANSFGGPTPGNTLGAITNGLANMQGVFQNGLLSSAQAQQQVQAMIGQLNNAFNIRDAQLEAIYGPGGSRANQAHLSLARRELRRLRDAARARLQALLASLRDCRPAEQILVMPDVVGPEGPEEKNPTKGGSGFKYPPSDFGDPAKYQDGGSKSPRGSGKAGPTK